MIKIATFFIFSLILIPSGLAFFEDSTLIPIYTPILSGGGSCGSCSGGGNITGDTTSGYIPYSSAKDTLSDSSMFFDGTYYGVGTETPIALIDVRDDSYSEPLLSLGSDNVILRGENAIIMGAASFMNASYSGIIGLGNSLTTGGGAGFIIGQGNTMYEPLGYGLVFGLQNQLLSQNMASYGDLVMGEGNIIQPESSLSTVIGHSNYMKGYSNIAIGELWNITGNRNIGIGINVNLQNMTYNNTLSIMSERMGIGTVSPNAVLELVNNYPVSGLVNTFNVRYYATGTSGPVIRFYKSRGSLSVPLRVKNGDTLGGFNAFGYYASSDSATATQGTVSGQFQFVASEDYTSTGQGSYFKISLAQNGTTSLTERMRISNNGYVGIGDTTPAYKLEINGTTNAYSYYSNSTKGLSVTKTVRNSADTGTCTLIYTGGLYTGGTC